MMDRDKQDGHDTHGETLIPKHGGYRKLKTFQLAQLVYDVTVRFCERFIDRQSRTYDQMVQAARSGVQNIAEGSMASGTSRKVEMKLTGIARASLEELRLDYEDFLRQKGLRQWERRDPRRQELIDLRPRTAEQVEQWVEALVKGRGGRGEDGGQGGHGGQSGQCGQSGQQKARDKGLPGPGLSTPSTPGPPQLHAEFLANAALTLIAVASALLGRQLDAQALAFETKGGFTERLYRMRVKRRQES